MVFDSCYPETRTPDNLRFRTPTQGEETDLVRSFLASGLDAPRRGQLRSVFVEPAIETGYPDAVIAYSTRSTLGEWSEARGNLRKGDLRVLQQLLVTGPTTPPELRAVSGPGFWEALERLSEAGIIYGRGRAWKARSLQKIFAVKRLVAIEAKLRDWRRGLWQAVRNTWFASESYLLVPDAPLSSDILSEARRLGVGVISPSHSINKPLVQPERGSLPRSYASWLFNEWVWRIGRERESHLSDD